MPSKRLTNKDRTEIVENGVKFVTADQQELLLKAGSDLLMEIRRRMYPKDILAIIDTMPEAFVSVSSDAIAKVGEEGEHSRGVRIKAGKPLRFAHRHAYCATPMLPVFRDEAGNAEFIKAVEAYSEASKALEVSKQRFKAMATATLKRFTTVEKLLDGWPECKVFLPAELIAPPAPKEYLPVPTQDLNAMIASAVARKETGELAES